MTPDELAKALGGSRNGKWYNIPGPAHNSWDRSLGFCCDPLEPSGIRIHSLAGDAAHICRHHVVKKLSLLSAVALPAVSQNVKADPVDVNAAKALSLWHSGVVVVGTPVETYLAVRGCLPSSAESLADVIRFHPNCPMGKEMVPAMVSMMRDVITGQPTGIHRTALADNGSAKRPMPDGMPAKMMLGRAKGAVIMLSNSAPVMGIAEGIETALSAQKIFGMPVWACMSAPGIAGFPALPGLKHLTIFADHDEAGILAARKCAGRLFKAGIKGVMKYPSSMGGDWNCYLQKGVNNVF